jgi:nitroreductase
MVIGAEMLFDAARTLTPDAVSRPDTAAGQDPAAQPGIAFTPDIAMLLVGAAVRAPSLHNSQPWQFRQRADGSLELYADRRRALPATDPHGRELVISCGAALATLALGVRWLGAQPRIHRQPDPGRPDLLARIELIRLCETSPVEIDMFLAVLERRTHRGPFADIPVEPELLGRLRRTARRSGCRLHTVPEFLVPQLSRLALTAQRVQRRQPAVQQEVAAWLRPPGGTHRDGVVVPVVSGPLGSRWSAQDRPVARRRLEAGRQPPVTLLLSTQGDDVGAWLQAGQALQHMLLLAARQGAYASFHTEVLEVPATRRRVAALTGAAYPQMLLRLGYADGGRPAPRRPPTAVLAL